MRTQESVAGFESRSQVSKAASAVATELGGLLFAFLESSFDFVNQFQKISFHLKERTCIEF